MERKNAVTKATAFRVNEYGRVTLFLQIPFLPGFFNTNRDPFLVDVPKRFCGHPDPDPFILVREVEPLGDKIRSEFSLGLPVREGNIVPDLDPLSGKFTYSGHDTMLFRSERVQRT